MKLFPIGLIVFGLIIIFFPQIIAYLLGGFFIFIGLNILVFSGAFSMKNKNNSSDSYVKFGKYKIFKD